MHAEWLVALLVLGAAAAGGRANECEPAQAPRGGRIAWDREFERRLAGVRACAEEECAFHPVLVYVTADW